MSDAAAGDTRLLVIGGAGFVGRSVVALGRERGFGVGVVVHRAGAAEGMDGVERLEADVTDFAQVVDAIQTFRPTHVLHLAARVHEPTCRRDPFGTLQTNVIGTVHVLEACRRAEPSPRAGIALSSAIYGEAEGTSIDEDSAIRPITVYGSSKAAADAAASAYGGLDGFWSVRFVPFNVIGPGQSPAFVVSDWARQVALIERGASPSVLRVGDMGIVRDFMDVRDAASGMLAGLIHGRPGKRYNIASGAGVELFRLVDLLRGAARCDFEVEVDRSRFRWSEIRVQVGSHRSLTADTGWEPRVPLEETITGVLDDWREKLGEAA